jgi:hypothetical protein
VKPLTVTVRQEGEHVVAVLLDHFIAGQGRTVGDALAELGRLVTLTIFVGGQEYFDAIPPAPPDLWEDVRNG